MLAILKPSGTEQEVRERLIMEGRLGPRVGRTSLRNLGGITSKVQEDRCIWDIMTMRLCREIGEKSDRRVGQWTGESVETVGLLKLERMMLILLRKEDSQLSQSDGEEADTMGWAGFTSWSIVLNRNLGLCLLLVIRSEK